MISLGCVDCVCNYVAVVHGELWGFENMCTRGWGHSGQSDVEEGRRYESRGVELKRACSSAEGSSQAAGELNTKNSSVSLAKCYTRSRP